ncbi:hypothetical protein EBZ37_14840, partial [bacterium]|nr:hypothetical protein [bacterium]
MDRLFQTLNRREDAQLTPKIAYVGHNKKSPGSHQINALFAYTWDSQAPEGEGDTFFQIDFEGSEYESGRPSEWAKFSYSSAWRDVIAGVKGLAHKVLLFSIAAVRSPPPVGAREATPTATAEKPAVKMTANPSYAPPTPEEIEKRVSQRESEILAAQKRKNPEKAREEAERRVRIEIGHESKMPAPLRPVRTLDLVTGLGDRYQRLDWTYNGDEVYKYLKRAERTNAIRDVKLIFDNLMGVNPPATEEDLENFGSFLGALELLKNRFTPQEIVKVYEEMVDRFFGDRGQQLSATDPEEDRSVKDKVLEVFRQHLPEAEASTINVEAMKNDFYSRYKIRGQAGFVEDDDQPRVDESRMRR